MRAVFATETLAAGINMPARTTVICAMATRGDSGSMNLLETSNLLRSKDDIGSDSSFPALLEDTVGFVESSCPRSFFGISTTAVGERGRRSLRRGLALERSQPCFA